MDLRPHIFAKDLRFIRTEDGFELRQKGDTERSGEPLARASCPHRDPSEQIKIDITAPNERSLYLQEASRNWRTREAAKTATDKDAVLIAFSMSHNSELPEKKSTIYQVKRRKERLNESGLRREKAGETPEEDEKEDGWELQTREQLMKKFNIFMEPHHKRTAFLTDRELEIGPSRVFVFKGVKTTVMPTTSQRSMKIGGWNGNDVHIVKTIAMERDLVDFAVTCFFAKLCDWLEPPDTAQAKSGRAETSDRPPRL